ncbi:hypothetical protein UlMin_000351 [Ulmus minor]
MLITPDFEEDCPKRKGVSSSSSSSPYFGYSVPGDSLNAIHLEEKDKKEREMRNQIIEEAEEYKRSFYEKRKVTCETNKTTNREREKKFHKEVDKHYWKAISEIIAREVLNIEKKRGKKNDEKKPGGVVLIQGPKPGKPTDLARMHQILLKLKQKPVPHKCLPYPSLPKMPRMERMPKM